MKITIFLMIILVSFSSLASVGCSVEDYVKSPEGQEKLGSLVEQSKSLIISKVEELGIDEQKVEVKASYPKAAGDLQSSLTVHIQAKNLSVEGSSFIISKSIREDGCGIEVSIKNGDILNKESGKNFGSLGRIKEFIKIN